MTNDITEPLRLAVGSHKAGSGKGCAMNIISWENGDREITDYPKCTIRALAKMVQNVNDNFCSHRENDLLCPDCSVKVLALAHRVVGTNSSPSFKVGMVAAAVYSYYYRQTHRGDTGILDFGVGSNISAEDRLAIAHQAIDMFEEMTGIKAPEPDPQVTACAYAQMTS